MLREGLLFISKIFGDCWNNPYFCNQMKRSLQHICVALLVYLIFTACKGNSAKDVEAARAMYFWRTDFRLGEEETAFLQTHNISKIYLRYFDVVVNESQQVMPNATITFTTDTLKGIEIIPTVFIVEDCLHHNMDSIAQKLVARILQMNKTHHRGEVKEIQIDCDYTNRSRQRFFAFLEEMHNELQPQGIRLSATIRLHQLSMPPPPVDYGTLMIYNTGNVSNPNGRNPILSMEDVAPFLKQLRDYPLPLCAAYPIFDWVALYGSGAPTQQPNPPKQGDKGGLLRYLLYGHSLEDSSLYKPLGGNKYLVLASRTLPTHLGKDATGIHLHVGDTIHHWQCDINDILDVKDAVEKHRPGINNRIILYHLDKQCLNHYKNEDYEKIFSH